MSDQRQEKRRQAAALAVAAVLAELKKPPLSVFRPIEISGENWRLAGRLHQTSRRAK